MVQPSAVQLVGRVRLHPCLRLAQGACVADFMLNMRCRSEACPLAPAAVAGCMRMPLCGWRLLYMRATEHVLAEVAWRAAPVLSGL